MQSQSRVFQILIAFIVIVFVWSLYAGVAMPSARKAKQSCCASNLHQLSLAMQMYAGDNDDTLPPYPIREQDAWPQVLRHYALNVKDRHHDPDLVDVSTVKPFICPSRSEKGYGYGLNYYLAGQLIDTSGDPSKIVLLAESSEATDEVWWVNDSEATWEYSRYQPRFQHLPQLSIHPRGGNVVHLDGSLDVVKPSQLSRENWLPY